jgi:hypothetical protein
MKLSKEKRDRLVLVILVTAIAIATAYYFGVQSSRNQLSNWNDRAAEAEKKFASAQRFLKNATEIEARMNTVRAEVERVESEMVASADPYAWSYRLVQSFGEAHKEVFVDEITRPQLGQPVGLLPEFPYQAATFRVRGGGYFHDIGKFVADFENRFPYFRVQNLTLNASGARSGAEQRPDELAFTAEIVALVRPTADSR